MRLRKHALFGIAIIAILVACNFPGESKPAALECDVNGDGAVSDEEQARCEPQAPDEPGQPDRPVRGDEDEGEILVTSDGDVITYVESAGIGNIVVRLESPPKPRYPEGAPIVVNVSGFFVPFVGFHESLDVTVIGAVNVNYLWPGYGDPITGVRSDGEYDHGGPDCLAALRDVIRFASGTTTDIYGNSIADLLEVTPLTDNVGLYAFSHPGVVATNVIALHGSQMPGLKYLVGRENPTEDAMYALEPGHFDDSGRPLVNPYYDPLAYTPTAISIDYSQVGWLQNDAYPDGWPYFAVPGGEDYVVSSKHPQMYGKDFFSIQLLQALLDNGALTLETWPQNLATPEEARDLWPFRTTVNNYPLLRDSAPELKVMLVFGREDHVQTAIDKPHIHQAYDGFQHGAGLWVRLNPDQAYVQALMGLGDGGGFTDNPANSEPGDWMEIRSWGHPGAIGGRSATVFVPLAAVSEMIDRVQADNWDSDLDAPLYDWQMSMNP